MREPRAGDVPGDLPRRLGPWSATAALLVNALVDPGSRGPTAAVLGVVAAGVPVYYLTVGRARP